MISKYKKKINFLKITVVNKYCNIINNQEVRLNNHIYIWEKNYQFNDIKFYKYEFTSFYKNKFKAGIIGFNENYKDLLEYFKQELKDYNIKYSKLILKEE